MGKRAGIWIRVSTVAQDGANQMADVERLARERGLEIVIRYEVGGRSAWSGAHMSDLERALADARNGVYDVLIIWSLDRLSRGGPEATLRLVREFAEAGVSILSCREPWLDGGEAVQDLMLSVIGWTARFESDLKSERVKASYQRAVAEGRWPGGKTPFGYSCDENRRLVIVESEAAIVRLIFDWYDTERVGFDIIERRLSGRFRSSRGNIAWQTSTISKFLGNPVYYGEHETGISAPPIISKAQFDRVQARRSANRHRKPTPTFFGPFQGRMKCGRCDSSLFFEPNRRGSYSFPVYVCRGRRSNSHLVLSGGGRCDLPTLGAPQLEGTVYQALRTEFGDPDSVIAVLERAIEAMETEYEDLAAGVGEAHAALAEVDEELQEIERARIRRRLAPEELDRMEKDAERRQAELVARLEAASPERRAEIDRLKRDIAGARDLLEVARRKKANGARMRRFSVNPDYAMSDEALAFSGSLHWPLKAKTVEEVQRALKTILDRINARLTVFEDRVEIAGIIPVEAALNLSTSGRELEGG